VEDCVQSGSLFGKCKGDARGDVVLYSGGLDKTPACFGAGFGCFRDSAHGKMLYDRCKALHDASPLDSWKARQQVSVFNQTMHLMIAKNTMWINHPLGFVACIMFSERGEHIKWHPMTLAVRKNKAVSAFQHAESGFLRKPSVHHLMSVLHGLSKAEQCKRIAKQEIRARDVLLASIPSKHHSTLFPWGTLKLIQAHRDNQGMSEFTWVFCPISGGRSNLCQFGNYHFLIMMINATWDFNEYTKLHVGKEINENLVCLPNLNLTKDDEIKCVGQVMTKCCQSLEAAPKSKKLD
jgi:hypothetical protein